MCVTTAPVEDEGGPPDQGVWGGGGGREGGSESKKGQDLLRDAAEGTSVRDVTEDLCEM